jgi:YbbR domain-containing protein
MMSFFRNLIVRNWALKLFSFFLALVLWLILIPEEKTYSEKTIIIPLETRNIPTDVELVEKPVPIIDVTVRAPNRLINQISTSDLSAVLDLGRAAVYQEEYPLNASMITVPSGAEVIKIQPTQVRLKLEKTKEMDLEIVPTIIGKVGNGLKITKIEVNPPRIAVKGPESRIKSMDKVTTVPVDVTILTQTAEFDVDLILPKPDLRLASGRSKVRIRINVEAKDSGANVQDNKKD